MEDFIVCRCEAVSLHDVITAAKTYKSTARELKLRTRIGMGICGGRTCRPIVDHVITNVLDTTPTQSIPLKVQPPVRPVALHQLGEITDE